MHIRRRLSCLLTVTAIAAGLTGWLPTAAQAAAPALSITTDGDPTAAGSVVIHLTGTAANPSYLWVYDQPTTSPCLATPHDELLANDQQPNTGGGSNNGVYTLPAGDFTEQASMSNLAAGSWTVCGYLEEPSSDPSKPGPMYTVPVAAANAAVISQPCGDKTFSITHVAGATSWNVENSTYSGSAAITVTSHDPGEASLTTPDGKQTVTTASSGTDAYDVTALLGSYQAGTVVDYTVGFYPGLTGRCSLPDGTVETTGPGGTYNDPPVTVVVTWNQGGQGVSATVNGVVLPGSQTAHDVPHTPTITGTSRVGETLTCAVTVPAGDTWAFGWWVDGKWMNGWSGPTYTIPGSAYGKKVTCGVVNNGTDGFPLTFSPPVTVSLGPALTAVSPPKLMGAVKAGYEVAVSFGKWAPAADNTKYAYQWYVGSKPIRGATKNGVIVPAKKGKLLSCRVTATAPGYAPGTATTKPAKIK